MVEDEVAGRHWTNHLEQIVRILDETSEGQDRVVIATECKRRFAGAPTDPLGLAWLRGLFRFDPESGAQVLEDGLMTVDERDRATLATKAFAVFFGDHMGTLPEIGDPSHRASTLGKLVRCAYKYVRHEDDKVHKSFYKPDTRDHAERARMFLLSALQETPGPGAYQVLLELFADPLFAHFSDRLELSARHRAAKDAEFAALTADDLKTLENRHELPPHDRAGLFALMVDRLDDLAHDIAYDDFTDRRTLRGITDEAEMQRTLARRLRDSSRGAYVVKREPKVADLKRTDIVLTTVRREQSAAIEVKIVDNGWALTDLERALRNQLVGQYLRHDSCKAGCLLLTYNGTKHYWEHETPGARLRFDEVVYRLNQIAKAIEAQEEHGVVLTVCGLDLTDPVLAPAHRR
jgi:hypothetical protein